MTPELLAKDLTAAACAAAAALGFTARVTLEPSGAPVDFDSYSQHSQALLARVARSERHVRAGSERLQLARGSQSTNG